MICILVEHNGKLYTYGKTLQELVGLLVLKRRKGAIKRTIPSLPRAAFDELVRYQELGHYPYIIYGSLNNYFSSDF